ncbi:MAG: hypothetical protein P4L16_03960 [Chlamydiales bacterium]|nr:hypothetical protein [Chlamydiales bacterium]
MISATQFFQENKALCIGTLGLAFVFGYLGPRLVHWIKEKLGLIQRVDAVAMATINIPNNAITSQAATTIQNAFRAYIHKKHAAITIQKVFRGHKGRIAFKHIRESFLESTQCKLLNAENWKKLYFVETEVNGSKQVRLVKEHCQTAKGTTLYKPSSKDALSTLIKMLESSDSALNLSSIIPSLISFELFIQALISPDSQAICRVCEKYFEEIHSMIQQQNLSLDWGPSKQEVFLNWIRAGYYYADVPKKHPSRVVQLMLEQDPALAAICTEAGESALSIALQRGAGGDANALLDAMERCGHVLSESEFWLKTAFQGNTNFADDAFSSLPEELKRKAYTIANIYGHEELVTKLNRLGMRLPSNSLPFGVDLLSVSMDAVQAKETIRNYLKNLRKEGRLLTEDEFNTLPERNSYRKKGGYFQRIAGTDCIAKKIEELQTHHIKVPRKIAVMKPEERWHAADEVLFETYSPNAIGYNLGISSTDFECYAQEIKRSSRNIRFEEMEELVKVIEATHYGDLHLSNFIIAEDGIYFIDNEYHSFYGTSYDKLYRLSTMLASEDVPKFYALIERQRKIHNSGNDPEQVQLSLNAHNKQQATKAYYGLDKRTVPYRFSIQELTS